MCGIVGYKPRKEIDLITLKELLYNSKIRGLHAFGISYYDHDGKLCVYKTLHFDEIIKEIDHNKTISWKNGFIFHSRYSTSGDFHNHNNNMPLMEDSIANAVSIVLNGVISMKTVLEYEKQFEITCFTQNDAEIFLKLLQKDALNKLDCTESSIAAIWLKNRTLFAFRNNKRPLYQAEGFIFSTYDIGKRSGLKNIKPVEAGKIHDC